MARVTPIHKKDFRDDISNYRPISILPIASNILEKHVLNHFDEYMTSYNLINQKQSGFRANHSCETALTLMVVNLYIAYNACCKYSSLDNCIDVISPFIITLYCVFCIFECLRLIGFTLSK